MNVVAFDLGFLAAASCLGLGCNPFGLFLSDWSEWNRGWMAGNRFNAEVREFFDES